ncbi:uncharacterized protein METZ01_LOCUS458725, partial [marine metagenome]
ILWILGSLVILVQRHVRHFVSVMIVKNLFIILKSF